CDPLALETKATPVEESTGVLESMFGEGDVSTNVFSDFVICALSCVFAESYFSLYYCDPLALETKATPVEESTGVLESMFGEGDVATNVFSDFVICAVLQPLDNLDELAELHALQRQEQAGLKEADRIGLAFPSLNLILDVGSASIGSSIFAGSTPPVSAGSTPPMSSCAYLISTDRHFISAGKSHVSAGRLTGSAGRPIFAGRPSGSADRTTVPAGRILGKFTTSASSERFPRGSNVELLDIHNGLKIFDCPKSGIFTSSSYDEEFAGPDAHNLECSLDVQPTIVAHALSDPDWLEAMQEEMQQFRNQKARLVAQGHRQEEGIDYSDIFAPVAKIEAIRLFLAFVSFIGFRVYQMDVKSAFLYEKIAEEVYVTQPRGFEDPDHPKKVYKVVKALYGLYQAPRAWYERLSTFLLKHVYRRGTIDKTLFIKKDSKVIMLVQVYVDDIIFGSTRKDWCDEFKTLMQSEFEMSSMGPLTFFLGLQVDQRPDGIFIHQEKYVADILKI
nr:retrovirus-related Pol polyprotein from transposon TNT 1-94 [Tanacetum cinerariifolium]